MGSRTSRPKRIKRVAIPVVILTVIYAAVSFYIADSALDAEANPLEERPQDFALHYEEVEFTPRGRPEIVLRGWWMPAPDARATVIRVHGIDSNRSSLLGMTPALVESGYSVLAFDLRGHGESDQAQMGAGVHEQDDLLGAVDYLIRERGAEAGAIFLHGNSYGGAIALMSGWREPAVAGVFADSAFASLSDLVVQEVARRTSAPFLAGFRPEAGGDPDGPPDQGYRHRRGVPGRETLPGIPMTSGSLTATSMTAFRSATWNVSGRGSGTRPDSPCTKAAPMATPGTTTHVVTRQP